MRAYARSYPASSHSLYPVDEARSSSCSKRRPSSTHTASPAVIPPSLPTSVTAFLLTHGTWECVVTAIQFAAGNLFRSGTKRHLLVQGELDSSGRLATAKVDRKTGALLRTDNLIASRNGYSRGAPRTANGLNAAASGIKPAPPRNYSISSSRRHREFFR